LPKKMANALSSTAGPLPPGGAVHSKVVGAEVNDKRLKAAASLVARSPARRRAFKHR
jgi:hypothetical protein